MASKIGLWLPLIVWMAVIFLFSTDLFSSGGTGGVLLPILALLFGWILPDESLYAIHFLIRKTAHFTEYAILGVLFYRALNKGMKEWRFKTASWAFLLSFLYAVTDEIHQAFMLTRSGRAGDVLIDSSGALAAMIAVWFYTNILTRLRADERK